MRRRSRASSKVATARSRKAKTLKAVRHSSSSASGQETEVARLTHELHEAQEQQTATAEVLKIVSTSPTELQSVLEVVVRSAARFCQANDATIYELDGQDLRIAAHWGTVPQEVGIRFPCVRGQVAGRAVLEQKPVHVIDLQAEAEEFPGGSAFARRLGHRTTASVPLLREGVAVGAIGLRRAEVNPFTDKQITLLETFAAQAVIAIENARLLNELRDSLEQQTAAADVLGVISSSPGELKPVFQTMLENATRICQANFGFLHLYENGKFQTGAARYNMPPAFADDVAKRGQLQPGPLHPLVRLAATKQLLHIIDYAEDPAYKQHDPLAVRLVELASARTLVEVPMLKDGELIGAIAIYRQEVRPFTEKQIELVQNFAAQAVIAIENARLLNELRQRTADLSESLEQQTATADVLSVISSSPGELKPVFQTILENATRICEAKFGLLFRFDGKTFQLVAEVGASAELAEFYERRGPFHPGGILERLLRTKDVVCVADASAEPVPPPSAKIGGAKSSLNVPMFKDEAMVGAITIYRQEVRPFTDRQIALLENFAAQAVIAIENARLLNELRDRTQEVVKLNQQLEQRVADQVGEIERMGRLRRFLPPQVADLIVASGTEKQLESHRREITALFCDLRGFTGFSESSDPEDVMSLLADYHAAIGTIINKYSGTLERYAGDGVMVIFNDPVPVDNPALQAVLMALEMRTAIGGLIEKWRDLGHDLGFGIGIAHGFATLGTIGFEGRRDYAAIGTVSNVASRLCDEAKPGQILISPRVRQSVEKAVTVESVGEFTLKGIRRPMMACNVLASSTSKSN
jgi:class 3 adenylate cyclase/putative methionine-R-sulfoxide reductase with GAF domain